jgi:hypothetical protein
MRNDDRERILPVAPGVDEMDSDAVMGVAVVVERNFSSCTFQSNSSRQ